MLSYVIHPPFSCQLHPPQRDRYAVSQFLYPTSCSSSARCQSFIPAFFFHLHLPFSLLTSPSSPERLRISKMPRSGNCRQRKVATASQLSQFSAFISPPHNPSSAQVSLSVGGYCEGRSISENRSKMTFVVIRKKIMSVRQRLPLCV